MPNCEACDKPFSAKANRPNRFCSRPCMRSKNGGHNRKPETWWTDTKGYVQGRIWENGVQRRVKKHRLIMERHLGRALLPDEDVHHKDGNKQNNAIENLEVIGHGAHSLITNQRPYRKGYRLSLTAADRKARSERAKAMRLGDLGRNAKRTQ